MHDFDEWYRRGTHWHAYVEQRIVNAPSTRVDRLRRPPDHVLAGPARRGRMAVSDEVRVPARRTGEAVRCRCGGTVGDDHHLDRDLFEDEQVASYGDSIHLSFACEYARLDLWGEAVTAEDCSEVLDQEQE